MFRRQNYAIKLKERGSWRLIQRMNNNDNFISEGISKEIIFEHEFSCRNFLIIRFIIFNELFAVHVSRQGGPSAADALSTFARGEKNNYCSDKPS